MAERAIVVGPFHGEAGIEALYWIPYLRFLFHKHKIKASRVYAITRGGAGVWYGLPDGHTVDIFRLRPLDEIRRASHENRRRVGMLKQVVETPFDRGLIDQACATWGLRRPVVIHPLRMFHAFRRFFGSQDTIESVLRQTAWDALQAPPKPAGLPDKYIAVGLYVRATLPGHHTIVHQMSQIVHGLAEKHPVVVIQNPHHTDDHHPMPIRGDRIFLPDQVPPHETLAQHSAIIAHARSFFGSYGGLQQIAMRLGRPSVGVYQALDGTCTPHLYLSEWLANRFHLPFYAVCLRDLPMLGGLFHLVDRAPEGSS